jgi:hypothetical protein
MPRRQTTVKKLDVKKLLEKNPQIDKRILRENIKILEELRSLGVPAPQNRLIPPYKQKRVRASSDDLPDSRTMHLPRMRYS